MSTSTSPLKATQIVAGVAVVLALLGGAYAVGRSQGPTGDQPPVAQAPERSHPMAAAEARPRVGDEGALAALCQGCARVTDVHTEARRGQASGVGVVGGAVVGGLLGSMVGGGNGKKLATVGGAVAGGYAGNEIEKNQKTHSVWVVQVQERDGRTHRFERSADPGLRVGDEVRLSDNGFSRV